MLNVINPSVFMLRVVAPFFKLTQFSIERKMTKFEATQA
jgi:hypothetical protein